MFLGFFAINKNADKNIKKADNRIKKTIKPLLIICLGF
jgi:hypothetical protein